MYTADLHIHSSISDGLLSPFEIIDWGKKKGLKALSITDHDSISAIDTVLNYSLSKDIELVPGLELSTEYNGVEVHMLGYFYNLKDDSLDSYLDMLRKGRIIRAEKMIYKLNNLGYKIKFDDVVKLAKDISSIGRPHIARVMINYGYCKDIEDAFDRFIGFGKPAFVDRYKISPFEAVEVIKSSGGVSSIAHPGLIINIDKLSLIKKLKLWGLAGIEAYHISHSIEDTEYFVNVSKELGLIITGGTDCHGVMTNGEPLIGKITVPYENVLKLKSFKR